MLLFIIYCYIQCIKKHSKRWNQYVTNERIENEINERTPCENCSSWLDRCSLAYCLIWLAAYISFCLLLFFYFFFLFSACFFPLFLAGLILNIHRFFVFRFLFHLDAVTVFLFLFCFIFERKIFNIKNAFIYDGQKKYNKFFPGFHFSDDSDKEQTNKPTRDIQRRTKKLKRENNYNKLNDNISIVLSVFIFFEK